ncbi:SCF E3 ubiquitin ligase complex F-box protein grrA [Peziza echinospora]|nr:SCF E3 ubiquitin ligase complex F-box protein grrA [Peziza echinospora]
MTKVRAPPRTQAVASEGSSSSSPERAPFGEDSDDFIIVGADESTASITEQIPSFRNMAVSTSPTTTTSNSRARKSPSRGDLKHARANSFGDSPSIINNNNNNNNMIAPIYRLPPELLIATFSKLISPMDLRNCMLVNKMWASCSVELLWHRPYVTRWPRFLKVVQAIHSENPTFPYPQLIRRLNLTFLHKEISNGTLASLSMCKRLERITLTSCRDITDNGLHNLIPNNTGLLALDLSGLSQLSDRTISLIADNCHRLQGLNIAGCRKITNASLIELSRNCRQLKRLKLNECELITDEAVIEMAKNCPHLVEVDLHKCYEITDASVAHLFTLRHLRDLHLAFCAQITDEAFAAIPNRPIDSLRIIDLTNCELITDEAVIKITSIAPRLRNLVLAKCKNITDRGVESICRLGKWIHLLALGHCSNITDKAVQKIARSCSRIRYIDLAGCVSLTDASVMELTNLPKLKRVGLVKCQKITDASIIALVAKQQTCVLERVHLSYCVKLTIEGITKLLNKCYRLTHLSLTGIDTFLHDDLKQFCREPPEDFTPHQRVVFCVFSGPGVMRLRHHLNQRANQLQMQQHRQMAPPPEASGMHMNGLGGLGHPNAMDTYYEDGDENAAPDAGMSPVDGEDDDTVWNGNASAGGGGGGGGSGSGGGAGPATNHNHQHQQQHHQHHNNNHNHLHGTYGGSLQLAPAPPAPSTTMTNTNTNTTMQPPTLPLPTHPMMATHRLPGVAFGPYMGGQSLQRAPNRQNGGSAALGAGGASGVGGSGGGSGSGSAATGHGGM